MVQYIETLNSQQLSSHIQDFPKCIIPVGFVLIRPTASLLYTEGLVQKVYNEILFHPITRDYGFYPPRGSFDASQGP